jgi:hypothetical protein
MLRVLFILSFLLLLPIVSAYTLDNKIWDTTIVSVKIHDTSQAEWRDYGDIFVLPTEDIEVLIQVKNTGTVAQEDWFVGVDFFRYFSRNNSKYLDLQVYYDGKSKNGGNLKGIGNASCVLTDDPNGNGVFDVGETILVECKAPASYWNLVNISNGEHIILRVHERDLGVDAGENGNAGNDWWSDALAKAAPLDILYRQDFEGGYPPMDWSGWGIRGGGYNSKYAAGTWLGFTWWKWQCTNTLRFDFQIDEPAILSYFWKLIRHWGDGYTYRGHNYYFKLYRDGVHVASAGKGIGDWSRVEYNLSEGSYTATWTLCAKQYDIESHEGLEALVDNVQIMSIVDYKEINPRVYTFTQKRDWCRYEYHHSWQTRWRSFASEKEEVRPTGLEDVECDLSIFYKQDTIDYYSYNDGVWFIGQTQEWWYGPVGYSAVGKDGEEGVNICSNYFYRGECYGNVGCLGRLPEECVAADTDPDPNDVVCTLYSSYPEGYSITKQFCPRGTIGTPDDGCYPVEYVQPTINITSHSEGDVVYTETVILKGTAYDDRGLTNIEVSVNNESFEPAVGNVSWEKNVTLRPDLNTIVARATNTFGVTSTADITITRITADMIPPNLSISYPEPHQKFENSEITVGGIASDNVALKEVLVKLNYEDWEPADGTAVWNRSLTLLWGANTIRARTVDTSGGIAESSIVVYYYIPVYVPPLPIAPPRPEEPELIPTSPTTPVGSITGVATGIFNITTTYDELLEAVEYQRRILDGTYDLAGRDVVYSEEVYGEIESVSPSPSETIENSDSTILVWRFPELGNGEEVNLEYIASFDLLPLEKMDLSRAELNYTDGVTGASVHRELGALTIEAVNVVNLSVATSNASYYPRDEYVLNVLVRNNGGIELRGLSTGGSISTPTGERVPIPGENITSLPPRASVRFSRVLDRQRLLAPGNYTVSYFVVDSRGVALANSSASFEVLGVVSAELDMGVDRTRCRLGEAVGLFVKVNNTSPNTPLEDAEVHLTLSRNGSLVEEALRNVSTLASGSTVTIHTYLYPNETGVYMVNASLRLRGENPLMLDAGNASFEVIAVPELVLAESLSKSEARALKHENVTIYVQNVGSGVPVNVTLMALLPQGFTPLEYTGSYDNTTNTIEWSLWDIEQWPNATRAYEFLTPFIYSYDPVEYTLRAKTFYADEGGELYSTATSEEMLVKPIPVIKGEIDADKSEAYIGNELNLDLNLSNIGYDDAVNISAVVSVPFDMEVLDYGNASFNASLNALTWSFADVPPNNSITLNFTTKALPINSVRNVTFQLDVTYFDEDGYAYRNASTAEVKVIPILVLAWDGDDSDSWFVDNATSGIAYVKKVNTTEALMRELRENFYSVLWLMNMGHCEYDCTEEGGLNTTEIDEVKTWLQENVSLTRELLFSDFTLKANPKLGELAGFKYVGSLPMGEPYQPRDLTITEAHYLTDGYEGADLSVVGWLDKIEPEYTHRVLAYADDLLPTKEAESYPALTLSYYNSSRVVFSAADIGLSSYEGLNSSVWLDIARRALLWSTVPVEEVSSVNVVKTVKPDDAKGKGKSAKVHVTIDLFSSGNLPAGNVSAAELFPSDFTIDSTDGNATNNSVTWSPGGLAPWTMRSLQCVLQAPRVNQTTSYTLLTIVNYTGPDGNLSIEIPSNVTIEPKGKGGGGKK